LERAYRDGIQNVSKLLAQTPKESMPSIARWIRENPIVGDIVELEGWVFTSRDEVSERQKRAAYLTETLDSAGAPYELTNLFRQSALRRDRGRPLKPAVREVAILALEEKRNDPKFSWMGFAKSHCPCEKSRHDAWCKESIRQAAMKLQRLMDRLGIAQ